MYREALDKITAGLAIVDGDLHVVFWNAAIVNISGIHLDEAIGRDIGTLCPKFREKRYADILQSVLSTGQSRFCSAAIHKAFVLPANCQSPDEIRQNMEVSSLNDDEHGYALVQITDISSHARKELKLKQAIRALKKGYDEIKQSEEEAHKKAGYDPLTGIYNRLGLNKALKEKVLDAGPDQRYAVFFIDIDDFKYINDTYGHLIGDVLLQQVAGRLNNSIRNGGDRPCDLLARFGGDEFVIILTDTGSRSDISNCAQRIVQTLRKPFFIDGHRILITLSLGISIYPDDSEDIDALIQKADYAMYTIKQSGKNNHALYGDDQAPAK
jgi:diguanylate cyclase (GGDEF)-like protein/PAS domain S-box-containing protein